MQGLAGISDGGKCLPSLEDILMRYGLELALPLARVDHFLLVQVPLELLEADFFPDHEAEHLSGAGVGVGSELVVLALEADLPEYGCELLHQRPLALHDKLKSPAVRMPLALLDGAACLGLPGEQEEEKL